MRSELQVETPLDPGNQPWVYLAAQESGCGPPPKERIQGEGIRDDRATWGLKIIFLGYYPSLFVTMVHDFIVKILKNFLCLMKF